MYRVPGPVSEEVRATLDERYGKSGWREPLISDNAVSLSDGAVTRAMAQRWLDEQLKAFRDFPINPELLEQREAREKKKLDEQMNALFNLLTTYRPRNRRVLL